MVGIFLHSCNAPEAVVEFLSRTGVSISRTSIDDAITNLSKEASEEIKQLGQTLLASYAYDNFDVEIKESIPTVEKPHDNLLHLISGTIFPLDHGVTREDLACAAELWEKSPDNPRNHKMPRGVNWKKLVALHPETLTNPSDLTRRQRFNAWKFVDDLVSHGPEYFHQFKGDLGMPEVIDAIPITKSKQVPVEGMDINQSTVQGNADALTNLFKQGGIGDPNEQPGVVDVGDHVIIVHGDLSTCERVQSVQMSRAEERTPWRRFQNVKFGNGLFHLKMACADAIWKVFIYPKNSREDDTSLMRMIAEIRPKETIKIGSKPGFRRMHKVIQHVGIVSRLDCWREEVSKQSQTRYKNLNEWAASKPTFEEIQHLARIIVRTYLPDEKSPAPQFRPDAQRDEKWENTQLRDKYFLLYEELTHAMNAGDIGHVETCFMPWVFIFKGCGKHKYATQMMKFLHDLHFVYPPGLR
ncbi:hypothetical protein A0H81_12571 [Grifola frondosa]|nr:hypothetical protein A0H81_12571 [Grifola frondosa]